MGCLRSEVQAARVGLPAGAVCCGAAAGWRRSGGLLARRPGRCGSRCGRCGQGRRTGCRRSRQCH
eukprot:4819487-Pyramimonas_sp.AAC.1